MAQIISLDKLKKLAKRPLAEAEKTSKFFQRFNDMFQDKVEELSRGKMRLSLDAALHQAYKEMKDGFLKKNCPPIRYIGEGSSRAAYALDGGQCLKIATSEAGIGQNEAEVKNIEDSGDLEIFPMLHGCADDCSSILVECIAPMEDSPKMAREMCKSLGLQGTPGWDTPTGAVSELLRFAVEELPGDFEALFEMVLDETQDETWAKLCEMVLWPESAAQRVLSKLARWTLEHSSSLDPTDLASMANWGFAVREGAVVPIVLDVGFSAEVRDKWY